MRSSSSSSSSSDDGEPGCAIPTVEPPPRVASIFAPGARDATTRESAKLDRQRAIRRAMQLNPEWVPMDGIGHRVHVDKKTGEVKRVVPSRLAPAAGGATTGKSRGDAAMDEYRRPISAHHAEYERLEAMGVAFDPSRPYVMDTARAHDAKRYVAGRGGTAASEVEYDSQIHAASKAGFVMFRRGIGFVHTNGAVSRCLAWEGAGVCKCGARHVA